MRAMTYEVKCTIPGAAHTGRDDINGRGPSNQTRKHLCPPILIPITSNI